MYKDISIITVVLNDAMGLVRTIESIKRQRGIRIQHIIVDGGSNDGSQEIAPKYSDLYVGSKPDGGIYQGMQRGASIATAPFLMFINSSDELEGNTNLSTALRQIDNTNSLWGFGPILEQTNRSTLRLTNHRGDLDADSICFRYTYVPFPVVIISRSEFLRVGGFSFRYRIAGDFDLIVKLAQNSIPTRWDFPLVKFKAGGISYTKPFTAWYEEHLIRVQNLSLSHLQRTKSLTIFAKRVARWYLGKVLDIAQLAGAFGKKHWRDRF